MKKRLLIVEDDSLIAQLEKDYLSANGYDVAVYNDGVSGLDAALNNDYNLIILDVMLPEMDGFTVCREVRAKSQVPIILLTARSAEYDEITGFDAGADDYLPKPFAMGELLARLRALTRRKSEFSPNVLSFGNLTLNRETFELCVGEETVRLGNKEFQMMEMLLSNAGRLLSTEQFMERIWGYDTDAEINVVWVYISYLRKKLSSVGADVEIKAVRGAGYTLEEIKC